MAQSLHLGVIAEGVKLRNRSISEFFGCEQARHLSASARRARFSRCCDDTPGTPISRRAVWNSSPREEITA
jgi:hypothetical protein